MKKFLPIAFLKWNFLPFENANISIATHALHYGIWAFWGLRALVNPNNSDEILLFRLDKHTKRLSQSAKFLWYDLSPDYIWEKIIEFIQRNKPQTNSYIRPFIYTSDLDLSPRIHDIEKDFLIYGLELGDYMSSEGISCTISSYMRQSDVSFPLRGKISWAYITSALAKTEAISRGFDEAILMNASQKVSEGSACNIFIVRDGVIFTPWVTEDILEGITRASVIELAQKLGYTVIERPLDKSELFIADEIFMTGTAAKLTPVKQVEQYFLPAEKPVYQDLKKHFDEITSWKSEFFPEWITKIHI